MMRVAAKLIQNLPRTPLRLHSFSSPMILTPLRYSSSSIRVDGKKYWSDEELGNALQRTITDVGKNAKKSIVPIEQNNVRYWPNEALASFHDIARKMLLQNTESPAALGKYTEEDLKRAVKKATDDATNKEKKADLKYTEADMRQTKAKIDEMKTEAYKAGVKEGKNNFKYTEADMNQAKAAIKEEAQKLTTALKATVFEAGFKAGKEQKVKEQSEYELKKAESAGEETGKRMVRNDLINDLNKAKYTGVFKSDYDDIEEALLKFIKLVTEKTREDSFAQGKKATQEESRKQEANAKEKADKESKKKSNVYNYIKQKLDENVFSITLEDIYKKFNDLPLTFLFYKIRRSSLLNQKYYADRIRIKDFVANALVAKNWLFQWTLGEETPITSNHFSSSARKKVLLQFVYIAALLIAGKILHEKLTYGETLSQYIQRKNRQRVCDKLLSLPEVNSFKKCKEACKTQAEEQMRRKHTMQARRENLHGNLIWFKAGDDLQDAAVKEAAQKALAIFSEDQVRERAIELHSQSQQHRK